MADNVAITEGSGTTIATDDITDAGGAHYQKIKLADGTANSSTMVATGNGTDTNALRVTVASNSTGLTVAVGNVAHDGTDSSNPVKVGGKAISDLAGATMVAAGDRANFQTGLDGVQIVRPHTTIGNALVERVSDTGGTSTALSTFGATANAKNCITTIVVYNAHASTSGYVDIRDGTGGSVLMTIPLPAGGGAVISLPVPLVQPTANTALAFDVSAAITTVYLTFIGFKSKA